MKRTLALLLTFLLLLSATACSNGGKTSLAVSWPRSEVAKQVPQPDFGTVKIELDTTTSLSIDVTKVTQDDFLAYVETCMDEGFSVDYSKTDTSFSAKNKDGYTISVFYWESSKGMDIYADAPLDKSSSSSSEAPTPEPETSDEESSEPDSSAPEKSEPETTESESPAADGIRPEFKEAMDSYESFMQEYADFMKKYKESDNALEMLSEYTDYMSRYTDFAEKWDEWDEEEMNDEELKYYMDVQTRVNKILIDVAS